MVQDVPELLEKRLGRLHAKLRLGIEAEHEAQVFGQGINYFHIENLKPSHFAIQDQPEINRIIRARSEKCSTDRS